jgi:hypothetical protein
MTAQTRLPFELDQRAEMGFITAHAGVPLVIEAFRTSGAAAVLDAGVVIKRRQRGLAPSALVEGLFSLWAAGGERCDDLAALRGDAALALLLGHGLPAFPDRTRLPRGVRRGGAAALARRAVAGAG